MTEENKPKRKELMLWRPALLSLFSVPCYVLSFSQIKATDFWEEPCLTSHGVKLLTALVAASATQIAVGVQYLLYYYMLNVLDIILCAMKVNPERVLLAL